MNNLSRIQTALESLCAAINALKQIVPKPKSRTKGLKHRRKK